MGISVGLESTALPVLIMSAAILGAYWTGDASGLHDAQQNPIGGLFGTAVATMGMLSTAVSKLQSEESVHRVYGKHCSYRHSDFYDLITTLNVFYRVTPFKQAQTSLFF